MASFKKELVHCRHPNSRKTKALIKRAIRLSSRNGGVINQNLKRTVLRTKVVWFQSRLNPSYIKYTPEQAKELIESYLSRFNDELEQIAIKHSIGNRKNRQHANREDIINMTIKQETEEFNTCGLGITTQGD